MFAQHRFEFFLTEPTFPTRRFKAAPVIDILIDDDELAAGLEHAAKLGDGGFNVDGMFQTFRRVDGVEGLVSKGVARERGTAGEQRRLDMLEHGEGEIHAGDLRSGTLL